MILINSFLLAAMLATLPDSAATGQHSAVRPVVLRADSVPLPLATDTTRRRARRSEYGLPPDSTWHYARPRLGRTLVNIPRYLGAYPKWAVRRDHRWGLVGVAGATGLLIWLDEPIINRAQRLGRALHLTPASSQTTLVSVPVRPGNSTGALDLELNVPTTLNGAMYFLGDGWTHLTITSAFWMTGLIRRDNRAAQTASQLTASIAASGIVVQTLKRMTGRESPFTTTYPRGRWRFFPNQGEYTRHVPQYDAFPSGHLATAMACVTVIADNYAEYRYIRPVGYSLMGLLGFAMLNNGVHWASDYPVGLAIGYGMGKLAVASGRTRSCPGSGPGPTRIGRGSSRPRAVFEPVYGRAGFGGQLRWVW